MDTANGTRLSNSDLDARRSSGKYVYAVAPFLATSSDRDDPWLCGYLEDMIYALAATNCNMGAKAADIFTRYV